MFGTRPLLYENVMHAYRCTVTLFSDFCTILLWGKIMAAVQLPKWSALNKCSASLLTMYCVAQSTHLHLWDCEACMVVGPTEDRSMARILCLIPSPFYHCSSSLLIGSLAFCSCFLNQLPEIPTSCERQLCTGNRLITSIDHEAPKLWKKTEKVRPMPATPWQAPRPCGLESRRHFRPQKNRRKNTE